MNLREQVEELHAELLKLAEEQEQRTHEKCAELLLAAGGLKMLENKLLKSTHEG